MKKLLLLAVFAVGCAKAAPPTVTVPAPTQPEAEAAPEKNPMENAVTFLRTIQTFSVSEFEQLCAQAGGDYVVRAEFHVCEKGLQGFSIAIVDGVVTGSSIVVPATGGELLAEGIISEIGPPTASSGDTAVWELEDGILVFAPVGNLAYIAILDNTRKSIDEVM